MLRAVVARTCLVFTCAAGLLAGGEIERLKDSLTSAAKAFVAEAPHFHAQEIMRYRKSAGGLKWDSAQGVSEYGFDVGPQGVRERRKLLRSSNGKELKPTITDLGQLLLLFERSTIDHYRFDKDRTAYVGAESAVVFRYTQLEGPETVTIQEHQKKIRQQTHGEIWVDAATFRILRITLDAERRGITRDHAEVEYRYTDGGAPVPVAALHREFHSEIVSGETLFTYKPLQEIER